MRMMDQRLNYGQICRVIKDVNSDIRQVRKESVGRKQVCKVNTHARKVSARACAGRACGNPAYLNRRMRIRKVSFSASKKNPAAMSEDISSVHQVPEPEEGPLEVGPAKRKRRSYDLAFKMEVVAYAQTHNKMKAARQFDIHRRCVQTWCKTKEKLESAANSKRMRLSQGPLEAPASTETLEVSISGITEEGELLAAASLAVTCANTVGGEIAALTSLAVNTLILAR